MRIKLKESELIALIENTIFKSDAGNPDKEEIRKRLEYERESKKTFYDRWNNNERFFTGLGSFHTALMQLYRLADGTNKQKLQSAFPEYFVEPTMKK